VVDVSLRDKAGSVAAPAGSAPAPRPAHRPFFRKATVILGVLAIAALALVAYGVQWAIEDYRDGIALKGLDGKPSPIALVVAGVPMTIPANMIRFRSERRGGAVDKADLVLHWPTLQGLSDGNTDDFKDPTATAPLIFATISARETTLDASARLDAIYSRFFAGPEIAGAGGLVGRTMADDSPYKGEIVYAAPHGGFPFVARCMAVETPDIPATCIRDIDIGRGLTMLYRFNRAFLGDWKAIDSGMEALAAGFVAAN